MRAAVPVRVQPSGSRRRTPRSASRSRVARAKPATPRPRSDAPVVRKRRSSRWRPSSLSPSNSVATSTSGDRSHSGSMTEAGVLPSESSRRRRTSASAPCPSRTTWRQPPARSGRAVETSGPETGAPSASTARRRRPPAPGRSSKNSAAARSATGTRKPSASGRGRACGSGTTTPPPRVAAATPAGVTAGISARMFMVWPVNDEGADGEGREPGVGLPCLSDDRDEARRVGRRSRRRRRRSAARCRPGRSR